MWALLELWYVSFSLQWLLLSQSWALGHLGSVVVAHGVNRSAGGGIFPDQGWNLRWQANSSPLSHRGNPEAKVLTTWCCPEVCWPPLQKRGKWLLGEQCVGSAKQVSHCLGDAELGAESYEDWWPLGEWVGVQVVTEEAVLGKLQGARCEGAWWRWREWRREVASCSQLPSLKQSLVSQVPPAPFLQPTPLSFFFHCSMWDLSSLTRDWTCAPCAGRQSLSHSSVLHVMLAAFPGPLPGRLFFSHSLFTGSPAQSLSLQTSKGTPFNVAFMFLPVKGLPGGTTSYSIQTQLLGWSLQIFPLFGPSPDLLSCFPYSLAHTLQSPASQNYLVPSLHLAISMNLLP